MPQYISQAPWYLGEAQGALSHQKSYQAKAKSSLNTWYQKGAKIAAPVTRFRKGACTNCGALTHDVKTCCERPRKVSAKHSGRDFAQDEVVQNLQLDWEGKRDRWNGYEPEMYSEVLEDWKGIEDEKVRRREAAMSNRSLRPDEEPALDTEKFQEYEHSELVNNIDPRTKTTTRKLRDREDVPAYLNNLDTGAAMYDGKSRAIQECLAKPDAGDESQMYRDSWMKMDGEMVAMTQQEQFAEKVNEKGAHLSALANPSQTGLMFKEYEQKKKTAQSLKQRSLLAKYGGAQHLTASDPTLLTEESHIEYAPDGEVVKPAKKQKTEDLEEDVHVNGHTTVWGSYYSLDTGLWGYACCKITNRGAACTKS